MRLTDEKIADVKEYLNRSIKVTVSSLIPQLSKYGIDLIDTIEALQQEIEIQAINTKTYLQEAEQLQTQVARMKNAIQYVLYHLRRGGKSWIIDKLEPVLSDAPTTYHNPADVEALRKAKEAISAWDTVNWCDCDRCKNMRDALAAIDALGGKEDV